MNKKTPGVEGEEGSNIESVCHQQQRSPTSTSTVPQPICPHGQFAQAKMKQHSIGVET